MSDDKLNGSGTAVMVKDESALTVGEFYVDLDTTAPSLGFDPSQDFDYALIYPQSYFSAEWLDEYHTETGNWITGTVVSVGIEQVQDPQKVDPEKKPDLVLVLAGGLPKCVLNKTRAKLMVQLTGTRNPRQWTAALSGKTLEFYVGTERSMSAMSQVLFREVDNTDDW